MPLSHHDQFSLLKDILNNHQLDCCGSVAECEQLERLVKSLLVNPNISDQIKPVLQEVYSYSQNGQYTQHLDSHIEANLDNLSHWIDHMNTNIK
ncbi:YtzH-like family protein [Heyndrickxia sp. NPDC080065]|uniref:YtzH-like family protein n=1 Tax=Heyndrickxia sp. NPDC080065 TaxID=3390568 RepID=UPI003D04CED7